MKLLEARTEASKNEMERMEAIEELQEMNKRSVKIDYDSMLDKYDKLREQEARRQEQEDDDFVKSVFGKDAASGSKVKRIVEDDDGSSDEDKPRTKLPKVEKATDILGNPIESKTSNNSWNKSIGSLGGGLKKNMLVKPKSSAFIKPIPVAETKNSVNQDMNDKKESEPKKSAASSLGLIANYSDSDESD